MNVAGDQTCFGSVQVVDALQEARGEVDETPAPKRGERARQHDVHGRRLFEQEFRRLFHAGRYFLNLRIHLSTGRFLDGEPDEEADQEAWQAEHPEHGLPPVGLGNGTGEFVGEPSADGGAQRKDGQGHRPARRREVVRQDGVGTRGTTGLADADADAAEGKADDGRSHATHHRSRRPHGDTDRHNLGAVMPVQNVGHREAQHDVEQGQRPGRQHRHALVSEVQVCLHGIEHGRHHIAVGNAERINEHHDDEHVPALGHGGGVFLSGRHGFFPVWAGGRTLRRFAVCPVFRTLQFYGSSGANASVP